jgi:hypothetical protein
MRGSLQTAARAQAQPTVEARVESSVMSGFHFPETTRRVTGEQDTAWKQENNATYVTRIQR